MELAQKAGIEVDSVEGGVMVNAELQARSDVFAVGVLFSRACVRSLVHAHAHDFLESE